MRRDAKLGLALGMLVVGFAAAFCFPRQPRTAPWMTFQEPEPIADSELDFLPIRAYQPASPESAPILSSPLSGTREESEAISIPITPPNPIGVAPSSISTIPNSTANGGNSETDGSAGPRPRNESSLVWTGPADVVPFATTETPAPQTLTYVVRPGDTLTGISFKFYGTISRYQQIFDANRSQLSSVDNLKVGTELVIPPKDNSTGEAMESESNLESTVEIAEQNAIPDVESDDPEVPSGSSRFQRTAGAPFLNDTSPAR
ncbi:MAG: LysM peptidoglycan-binding domain-containing protein [Planctomycetaceae bacterium]|nr:LysM peptidoglycan-binding domain-containing protein [Planctomycetaceae bacterium]